MCLKKTWESAGDVKVSIDVFWGGKGQRQRRNMDDASDALGKRELEELREIKLARGRMIGHVEQGSEADSNEQRRAIWEEANEPKNVNNNNNSMKLARVWPEHVEVYSSSSASHSH